MAYDYTKYDYNALVAQARALLRSQGGWADAYQSSTGTVLIQLLAATVDQLSYYMERRVSESYLPTAKLQSSVGAISNLLGYRPTRAISASGDMQLRLIDSNNLTIIPAGNITIPKYSKIEFDGKNFVNTTEINISPLDTPPYTFIAKEGTVQELTYDPSDATGTLFQKGYILITDYEYIEENSLVITTPTQEFYDVKEPHDGAPALESLAFAGPTDPVYDLRITNEGLQLLFGDDINGAKPVGTLTVKYILSSGETVLIPSTELDFVFEQSKLVDDSIPVKEYTYELINTSSIDGAFEPESIEKTKKNAPDYIRSGARAVVGNDYSYWVRKSGIGGVVDCAVYGEQEVGISVINSNVVWVTVLNRSGTPLTNSEVQELRDYMDTYKTITTHLVIQPADIIPLAIKIRLKRSNFVTAANSEIFDFVKSSMNNLFVLDEGALARTIYHSDLVNYVTGLQIIKDGIGKDITQYANIEIKALEKIEFPLSKTDNSVISIDNGADGKDFIISINGKEYKQTWSASDTTTIVASALGARVAIDEFVETSVSTDTITISLDQTTRSNELTYSNDFSQSIYTFTGATYTFGSLNGPTNGAADATKIEEDNTFADHGFNIVANSGPKTFSIYAISGEKTELHLSFYNTNDGERSATVYDLATGIVVSGTGTIETIAGGWYRCTISISSSTIADVIKVRNYSGSTTNYQGVTGEGIYVFGAQLVYSTTPSHYLPTTGAARTKSPETAPYTLSFNGTTTIADISLHETWQLPVSQLKNDDDSNLFVPGSVEFIKEDGTVLLTDDGAGNIGTGTVNYVTGEVVLPVSLDDGVYYFRYSQDQDNNFVANPRQTFSYYQPKAKYSDTTETLSTIEII